MGAAKRRLGRPITDPTREARLVEAPTNSIWSYDHNYVNKMTLRHIIFGWFGVIYFL